MSISLQTKAIRVSLESLGLEYRPEVSGNRAEVGQNHDAPKTVSATLSVLNWSGVIFRLRSPQGSVEKVLLSLFQCKPRQSGVTLESPVPENIPHFPGNRAKGGQNHDARKAVSAIFSFFKVSSGYVSAEKLQSESSKTFAVFISLQTKAIRS